MTQQAQKVLILIPHDEGSPRGAYSSVEAAIRLNQDLRFHTYTNGRIAASKGLFEYWDLSEYEVES